MNDLKETTKNPDSWDVVRLEVQGASSTVNTFREQQTARGVSLVCPFPALEVDIPVSFAGKREEDMHQGAIHRIGVEDDPETGLPRLRLSIRMPDNRSTAVSPTPVDLIDESDNLADSLESEVEDKSETDIKKSDIYATVNPSSDIISHINDSDPAWTDCSEVPSPDEFMELARTRRRYKLAGKAAFLAVFVMIALGGFLFERAGLIDVRKIRSFVAGFSMESFIHSGEKERIASSDKPNIVASDTLEQLSQPKEESHSQPLDEVNDDAHPSQSGSLGEHIMAKQNEAFSETKADITPVSAKTEEKVTIPDMVPNEIPTQQEDSKKSDVSLNEATLVLPTRWPVEYSTSYRIRNPNGVVVDVPGGLVKREGWLEYVTDHPMIRSIKAIQRETGARFVVYVHGELPRFMTSPKANGVSLRLYHLNNDAVESDQVAMLK